MNGEQLLGPKQFEFCSKRGKSTLALIQAAGLLSAGAVGLVAASSGQLSLQIPTLPELPMGLLPIVMFFCGGLFLLGAYLIWHEWSLRSYEVRVYELGLALSDGAITEICRWEQINVIIVQGQGETFQAIRIELKDRPTLSFSIDYFELIDLHQLDGALNLATNSLTTRPIWVQEP